MTTLMISSTDLMAHHGGMSSENTTIQAIKVVQVRLHVSMFKEFALTVQILLIATGWADQTSVRKSLDYKFNKKL